MRTDSTIFRSSVRRRKSFPTVALRRGLLATAAVALLVFLAGVAFGGSHSTIAAGTTIAGVDVGGLSASEATRLLRTRAAAIERRPVTFSAGGRTYALTASQLGVRADWAAAATEAVSRGDGLGPLRGVWRLSARFFGAGVEPTLSAFPGSLDYKLDQLEAAVNRTAVDAKLVRRGLRISVVEGRAGRRLDRAGAASAIVGALGSLERDDVVPLPVASAAVHVRAADLATSAQQARTALSAPVRLAYGETRWRLPRWRIAPLLDLPSGGATQLRIAGPGAEAYLKRLGVIVGRKPRDARFQVTAAGKIVIRPSEPGLALDVAASAKAIARAAFSPATRTAPLVVATAQPARTTEVAQSMGITDVVASYTTTYGGTPGRLHNVQLVSELIDETLIEPGGAFSFNSTTGERTAAKGFEEAPVIINGELQNGLGGGICQVSTTVFNAAFDAGLPIDERTNHALYISHYPLGRDATVNYPDLDLKFSNDTGHWLLLRTFVGSGSLTVNIYGTPVNRHVESTTAPLVTTGPVPVRQTKDPTLKKGARVVDTVGAPPRQTSVRRIVTDGTGKVLYDNTWRSYYVGEPTLVRVGTKKPPPKKGKAKGGAPPVVDPANPADPTDPTAPPSSDPVAADAGSPN